MKKYFVIAFILMTLNSQSQSKVEPINVNFFQTVRNSYNYQYYNNKYKTYNPYSIDWNNSGKQTRYDWVVDILRVENNKFINLTLINQQNVANLNSFHNDIAAGVKAFNKVDFSIWDNYIEALNYITQFLNIPTVRDEIMVLQKIDVQLFLLKEKDPNNYYTSEKFYKLVSLMNEIYSCPRTEISAVAYKYGFF